MINAVGDTATHVAETPRVASAAANGSPPRLPKTLRPRLMSLPLVRSVIVAGRMGMMRVMPVMRRMIGVQMLAFVMRAWRAPVTNALGVMVRGSRDEAPVAVVTMVAVVAVVAMMTGQFVQECELLPFRRLRIRGAQNSESAYCRGNRAKAFRGSRLRHR